MSAEPSWIGLHIHYNSDMQSLLGEGVAPALQSLRSDGLVTAAFLIRYWEQGPHIRVRLRPAAADAAAPAEAAFRRAIEAFLLSRPSLYSFPSALMRVNFNDAFRREYGDAEFERKYGRAGRIPFAPNNSIGSVDYEPEYDRYGGAAGMAIAETLFDASTTAVLHVLTSPNGADLSVRAGHAFKFLILGCRIFLTPERWAPFLDANQQRWTRFLDVYKIAVYDDMLTKYERQRPALLQELDSINALAAGRRRPAADEALLLAALHTAAGCLRAAHAAAALDARHQAMTADDLLASMFTSFLHMHCNRLGMLAVDEIYLSILGRSVLLDAAGLEAA